MKKGRNRDNNQVGVYVPISAVFPDMKNDIEILRSILSGLSRTDTLFWCARLNLVVSTNIDIDSIEQQKFGLNQFFSLSEIRAISNFIIDNGGPERVKIFFRGQLLELFRWVALCCVDHLGDGTTYEDPEIRRKFGQAALIASDIWSKRVFKGKLSIGNGIEFARKRYLGAIRQSVEANVSSQEIAQSLGRGYILFNEYFHKYYNSFYSEFFFTVQLSVEEYFICSAIMIIFFMDPTRNSGIFSVENFNDANLKNIFYKFLAIESYSVDEIKKALWGDIKINTIIQHEDSYQHFSSRPLREKPVLRTDDGRGIIVDQVFFSEKASIGPLFHILNYSNCRHDDVFIAFGHAFEEYTLDILWRMFSSPERLASRFSKNIKAADKDGKTIEIDGILNDVLQAVVFEVKAGFMPEEKIMCDDHEKLLHVLRERYSISKKSKGKTKLKGVGQLARAITSIASKRWTGNNNELHAVQIIYPALIVHDSLLTAPVYGNFFASEFTEHLQPDSTTSNGIFIKGYIRVAPVIIMSIDDLEHLEVAVEHFRFCDLIADYSNSCPDRLMSLHNFVAFSKKYTFYHNRNLASKALEVLDKCNDILFADKNKKVVAQIR